MKCILIWLLILGVVWQISRTLFPNLLCEDIMDVSSTTAVASAVSAASAGRTGDAVNISVLNKALKSQAQTAMTLIQSIPQPSLASGGKLGTQVNTFA